MPVPEDRVIAVGENVVIAQDHEPRVAGSAATHAKATDGPSRNLEVPNRDTARRRPDTEPVSLRVDDAALVHGQRNITRGLNSKRFHNDRPHLVDRALFRHEHGQRWRSRHASASWLAESDADALDIADVGRGHLQGLHTGRPTLLVDSILECRSRIQHLRRNSCRGFRRRRESGLLRQALAWRRLELHAGVLVSGCRCFLHRRTKGI